MSALNGLMDVKSATRYEYTMLHFLADLVEKQFPELLRLKRDLAPVFDAARVSRTELDSELTNLQAGLDLIKKEIALYQRKANPESKESGSDEEVIPVLKGDQFVPVMSGFLDLGLKVHQDLCKNVEEMRNSFRGCVKRFGADMNTASPDDFFGNLSKFLTSFSEVHRTMWQQREDEERRKRMTLSRNFSTMGRKGKENLVFGARKALPNPTDSRDFDQLISALQSGELFSEELSRLRSSFRCPKRHERASEAKSQNPQAPKRKERRKAANRLSNPSMADMSRDR